MQACMYRHACILTLTLTVTLTLTFGLSVDAEHHMHTYVCPCIHMNAQTCPYIYMHADAYTRMPICMPVDSAPSTTNIGVSHGRSSTIVCISSSALRQRAQATI